MERRVDELLRQPVFFSVKKPTVVAASHIASAAFADARSMTGTVRADAAAMAWLLSRSERSSATSSATEFFIEPGEVLLHDGGARRELTGAAAVGQGGRGRWRWRRGPERVHSFAVDEVATAPPRRASAAIARDDDGRHRRRALNLVRVSTQNLLALPAASPSSG